jgi:hypothetical protein
MKLKEVYKNNVGRKYRNVISTKGKEVELKSLPLNSIKKNKFPVIIISLITILILLFAFYNTLKTFAAVIIFLAFIVVSSLFFNNYSMKCKKDVLSLKWNFQKFDLPYTHLKSIFLSRDFNGLQFLPMINYNIVVRYIDNLNFIRELSFPAFFLKPEEVEEFIDNFVIEENKAEDCIKFEKYKKLKAAMKVLGFILFIILIIIVIYSSPK